MIQPEKQHEEKELVGRALLRFNVAYIWKDAAKDVERAAGEEKVFCFVF